jgi:hypothetical protein
MGFYVEGGRKFGDGSGGNSLFAIFYVVDKIVGDPRLSRKAHLGQVLQVSEPFHVFADQMAYMIFADSFFHGVVPFSVILGFYTNNRGRQLSRWGLVFASKFQDAGVL